MLNKDDVEHLKVNYKDSIKFIRPFIGGGDFINGNIRYCLWLRDASVIELRKIPFILDRIEKVKKFRLNSPKERTRHWANFPTLFTEDRQPQSKYLLIPKISSEKRDYVPIAEIQPEFIVNNTASYIPNAKLYLFGVLISRMHMDWMRYVCGRLESRYIYSNKIVYNNFPWPENPTEKQIKTVEEKAQKVLDVRKEFPDSSLEDLYEKYTSPLLSEKKKKKIE